MSRKQPNKRLRVTSSETSLDATTDDFEVENHQFRFHKKSKPDATIAKKRKEKSKKTLNTQELINRALTSKTSKALKRSDDIEGITNKEVASLSSINVEECLVANANCWKSPNIDDSRKDITSLEIESFQHKDELFPKDIFPSGDAQSEFLELEKSICSESERLCPSCKHIVPSHLYSGHFTDCFKKFSYVKGKKYDDQTQKEDILPCPVCLKPFNSKSQRVSHVKSCAQFHGLSGEQTILASRLQEKQIEERLSLGLPSFNFSVVEKKEQIKNITEKNRKKDPDLDLAVALSCSLAEEEKEKREIEEDALLQLGLPIFIQEKRRISKLVLPQPNTVILNQAKATKRRQNAKQRNTILMTRTAGEREQIISEKVASILSMQHTVSDIGSKSGVQAIGVLKHYQDKNCSIWNKSHSDLNLPIEENYVAELSNFINVKELPVGGLLKHYSQVPGRLNFTVANEDSNEQDLDDDENVESDKCETSIVDNYCTQLALAELLNSQDLSKFSFNEPKNDKQHDIISLISSSGSNSPQGHQIVEEEVEDVYSPQSHQIVGEDIEDVNSPQGHQIMGEEVEEVNSPQGRQIVGEGMEQANSSKGHQLAGEEEEVLCEATNGEPSIINEISSLKMFANADILQSKFICDWTSLLDSGEWSDMLIITKNGEIPCHSLVLKVRCPTLMLEGEVNKNEVSKKIINLPSISFTSVHKFVHYLYTGSIMIKSKDNPCWMELFDLALKFKCQELACYLESVYSSSPTKGNQNVVENLMPEHNANKSQTLQTPTKIVLNTNSFKQNSLESKLVDSNSPEVSNSPSPSVTSPLANYSSIQMSSPPCSPFTKTLTNNSSTFNHVGLFTSLNNSFRNQECLNKSSVKETQSQSDESENSSEQCYTISPDIFEESDSNCKFIKTPELTPPLIVRSNCENEDEPPFEGVEIFGDSVNPCDSQRKISRRKLFSNLKTCYSESVGNLSPKNNSPSMRSDVTSWQLSPLRRDDGVVDLTLSSDDSLEGPKIEYGACSTNGQSSCNAMPFVHKKLVDNTLSFVDKESLDDTMPFVDKEPLDDTMPFVDKEPLDDTMPFVDKEPLDDTMPFVDKEPLDDTMPFVDKEPLDDTMPFVDNVSLDTVPCLSQMMGRNENPIYSEKIMDAQNDHNQEFIDLEQTESYIAVQPSKNSSVLQNIIQVNNELELVTNRAAKLKADNEIRVSSPKADAKSLILGCVTSPDKEDSIVDTIWDDFDDGGILLDSECSMNVVTPSNQNTPVSLTALKSSVLAPSFKCSLETDFGHKSNGKEVESPIADAHSNSKDKSNSVNLGNDTLLMALREAETQNTSSSLSQTAKQPKGKPIYKSKSCTFGITNRRISEVQQIGSPSQLKTPVALKKWGSQNITPMPDYRTMVSPELKKELDRYGIRKLSRKKAITLLTHIYDQLHPFVSDAETDSSYVETPYKDLEAVFTRGLVAKMKQNYPSKHRSEPSLRSSSSTDDLNASQSSIISLGDSENECLEESMQFSDDDDADQEISITHQGSLEVRIKNLIKSDKSMHEKILLYEPIWANELHAALKTNDIKCSMRSLLDFLDQQCITFRLPTNRNRKKSPSKKGKQKSPTKTCKQKSPLKRGTQKNLSKKS